VLIFEPKRGRRCHPARARSGSGRSPAARVSDRTRGPRQARRPWRVRAGPFRGRSRPAARAGARPNEPEPTPRGPSGKGWAWRGSLARISHRG
jgi:hypothetical protein